MKLLKYIGIILIASIGSCKESEYGIIDNQIYISNAETNIEGAETIIMNDGAEIEVLLRLAKKVDNDIEVSLALAPELLSKYNQDNSTEYQLVPNFALTSDAKVKIPAGKLSGSYKIKVKDFETKGNRYALPLKISKVTSGTIEIANKQSKFIYALAKPLKVSVPVMSGANSQLVKVLPENNWGVNTTSWSLEAWVKMDGYSKNNQAIFNLGSSDHEIYIRFGDANSPYNYLQIKTLGGQIQTASDLVANKWYHWSFVFDGVTLSIYRDGELDVKFQPPAPKGGSVRIDYLSMISSGSWFTNRCHLAQVKLWKKDITQSQIKNNMYFEPNPNNPDLIAYWPMDEGVGNVFNDKTGNKHHATADASILKSWVNDIDFVNR